VAIISQKFRKRSSDSLCYVFVDFIGEDAANIIALENVHVNACFRAV